MYGIYIELALLPLDCIGPWPLALDVLRKFLWSPIDGILVIVLQMTKMRYLVP